MSYTFLTNQTPNTGPIAWFGFLQTLVTAGWVVESWSDGTTFHSTPPGAGSTGFTSGGTGAGGFGNNNAWFRIQAPGAVASNTREFTVQRGTSDTVYRVKYSLNAHFTGGTPGTTQTPSATDEQIVLGSGTDSSPTFTTFTPTNTNNLWHFHVGANNADGFQFYFFISSMGEATTAIFMLDFLINTGTGDPDPYIVYINSTGNGGSAILGANNAATASNFNEDNTTLGPHGYLNNAGNTWVLIPAAQPAYIRSSSILPAISAGSTDPWNQKAALVPVWYWRNNVNLTTPTGWKGSSKWLYQDLVNRQTGFTLTVNTTNDYIVFGTVAFPWDGSTPVS